MSIYTKRISSWILCQIKMTEEEKKVITREEHPGRVAQGHKLATLMKKRKEEILRTKEQAAEQSAEQFTEQSTEQSMEQSTEQSMVQPTEQPSVQSSAQFTEQSSVRSNRAYVYGVGMLVVLVIGVCIFFAYPKNKKQANEKQDQPPKRRHML